MATNDYDMEAGDSRTNNETSSEIEDDKDYREISSLKHGRSEEEEKCSPNIDKQLESKKLKKMACQWSWSDECCILKNFYEFAGKNASYSKDFYHFVKNKLSIEVSNSQLSDKVYRLKKRFLRDECKMMEEGTMKFSNAKQEKLFEMSSNIWGSINSRNQSESPKLIEWKPEAVNEMYEKLFKAVIENMKVDITCIPSTILEDIRKDWEQMKTAQNEYELKNANLQLEIAHIRCTQNNIM